MAVDKRRNNLTQGSLARKIEPHKNNEYKQSIENNPVIKEIRLKRANKGKKIGMVFKVAVVFSLALLVIFRYARITELGYEYNKYNKSYEDLIAENDRLNVEIEKSINLAKVRDIAENKLNMSKPETYQIIPIDVERADITEVSHAEKETEEKGFIGNAIDWIKGILGFME